MEETDREDPHTWLAAAKSNSKSMKVKHPDCQLSFLSPPTTSYHQGKHQPKELSSLQKGSVNTWDLQRLSNRNDGNLTKSDVLQHLPPVYLLINTKPQLLKKDANGHVWLKARLTLLLPLHMKNPRSVS